MSAKASSKAAAAAAAAKRTTRVVVLRLSPDQLAQFPSDAASSTQSSSSRIKADPSPSIHLPADNDATASDSNNATPAPNNDTDLLAPPETAATGGGRGKKKSSSSSDNSPAQPRKRAPPSIDPSKERGRPGPKKKPRLPDGSIDRTNDKNPTASSSIAGAIATTPQPTSSSNPIAALANNTTNNANANANNTAHKLGPKAHAGPINAGLRALDRTGKPCRRWARSGLTLKSFTGTAWGMQTWKAPLALSQEQEGEGGEFPGDVKSDSAGSQQQQDVTMGEANGGLESSPAPPHPAAVLAS